MSKSYDIVVLGGGIGGYTAAIRAAQLGKTVAIVERDRIGGTCLHRGCIPSKSYLRSAELYNAMKDSEHYGIIASEIRLDFDRVRERKNKIVEQLHQGVQYLMKKNKIEVVYGNGRLMGPSIFSPKSGAVAVELADGEIETLVPGHLIIATGSRPRTIPGLEPDGKLIHTSDEALDMSSLPSSVIIVGGGVIGVEWASMLSDFDVEVTIVEAAPRLVPLEDEDISKELERLFKKKNVTILTDAKLLADTVIKGSEEIAVQVERRGEEIALKASAMLVSIGRQANVDGMNLEITNVKVDRGVIKVNEFMQTAEAHIYAVGDVNGGLQLAHVAGHEGILAVEHIAGLKPHPMSIYSVPKCIYGRPEIASVGWTEKEAVEKGYEVKVGKFTFKAIGKALVYGESDGFVKVIADKNTDDILGVHMIGPHVTDYISEAALAQVLNATPWEVGRTIHPHPTLAEALGEAMLAVDGNAIGM
jgi:dihydrolipoamide dehydrogenase